MCDSSSNEFGTAKLWPDHAVAGQKGCWQIEYTAGAGGLRQGGGLRIVPPHKANVRWRLGRIIATCDDPRVFLEVVAEKTYPLTFHHSNYPAVWVRVYGADVAAGETVRVQMGVPGGYNSGWFVRTQAQKHAERTQFEVYVDPLGNAAFSRERFRPSAARKVAGELDITILPAREHHFRVSLRSRPKPDASEIAVLAAEDQYDNPIHSRQYEADLLVETGRAGPPEAVVKPASRDGVSFSVGAEAGQVSRIAARNWRHGLYGVSNPLAPAFFGRRYRVYFGDLHVMTGSSGCPDMTGTTETALQYARDVFGLDFSAVTNPMPGDEWQADQEAFRRYNRDHEFVTLPAYENGYRSGHKNVYYLDESLPAVPAGEGLPALWEFLADKEAMVISHHPNVHSETDPDECWGPLEISSIHPQFERLIEICQDRGSFEVDDVGGEVVFGGFGSSVRDVLARGYRLGFVGGTDNHCGRPGSRWCNLSGMDASTHSAGGITAVLAEELTRKAVWEALLARRCYATTGTRMLLDFSVNGLPMGQDRDIRGAAAAAETGAATENRAKKFGRREIRIRAIGTCELTEVVVVRNGREVFTQPVDDVEADVAWVDEEPLAEVFDEAIRGVYYYAKVVQQDGNIAWASPIWLTMADAAEPLHPAGSAR